MNSHVGTSSQRHAADASYVRYLEKVIFESGIDFAIGKGTTTPSTAQCIATLPVPLRESKKRPLDVYGVPTPPGLVARSNSSCFAPDASSPPQAVPLKRSETVRVTPNAPQFPASSMRRSTSLRLARQVSPASPTASAALTSAVTYLDYQQQCSSLDAFREEPVYSTGSTPFQLPTTNGLQPTGYVQPFSYSFSTLSCDTPAYTGMPLSLSDYHPYMQPECGSLVDDAGSTAASDVFTDTFRDGTLTSMNMVRIHSGDQSMASPLISDDAELEKIPVSGDPGVLVGIGSLYPSLTNTFLPNSVSMQATLSLSGVVVPKSEAADATIGSKGVSAYPSDWSSPNQSTGMERSDSNSSTSSNRNFRMQDRLRRQTEASKVPIAAATVSAASSTSVPSVKAPVPFAAPAANGAVVNDDKKEIAKTTNYTRPRVQKLSCNLCNKHPGGFRGHHELQRHKQAKHEGRKKWICRDPRVSNIPTTLEVYNPLSKCKACNSAKTYGADYNAAAHLRRAHFKIKGPRKGSSQQQQSVAATTATQEPSMAELKRIWIVEVNVPSAKIDDDMTDEDEMLDADASFDSKDAITAATSSHNNSNLEYGISNASNVHGSSFDASSHEGLQIDMTNIPFMAYDGSSSQLLNLPAAQTPSFMDPFMSGSALPDNSPNTSTVNPNAIYINSGNGWVGDVSN